MVFTKFKNLKKSMVFVKGHYDPVLVDNWLSYSLNCIYEYHYLLVKAIQKLPSLDKRRTDHVMPS